MGEITMKKIIFILLTAIILMGSSCQQATGNSDNTQAKKLEETIKAANQMVGEPNITNFTEKRFAKLIYELKDSEITTYSYFMDLNGRLHFLCESIGYGMPASVQYVNPQRGEEDQWGNYTLPQPEPNGLFMPEGLDATFVLCSDGEGSVKPVYSEPKLIVSPFELKHVSNLRGGD